MITPTFDLKKVASEVSTLVLHPVKLKIKEILVPI